MRILLAAIILLFALGYTVSLHAQSKADSLRMSINLSEMSEKTVDSIAELSDMLMLQGEARESKAWMQLGIEISEIINYRDGDRKISLLLAEHYLNQNISDSVNVYAERAYNLSDNARDRASAINMQANAHSQDGRHIIALDLYEEVVAIMDSLGMPDNANRVRFNIARAYTQLGDNMNALQIYYNAYEYAENKDDYHDLAIATNNIGNLFKELENYDQAEYFLLLSENISNDINFVINLARVYLNLGNLYSETGEYERASEYFDRSMVIREQMNDDAGKAQIYYNIGMMYTRQGNFEQARDQLQRSIVMSQELGLAEGLYYGNKGMGRMMLESGRIDESINWFERARTMAEDANIGSLKLSTYNDLYEAHKEAGNIAASLNWLERFNALNDSLNTAEKNLLAAQYEAKFNLKQSQQQNELFLARQEQQEAQLSMQRLIIGFSIIGITFLLIGGIMLLRTNHQRKESNKELKESNRQLNELNDTIKNQNDELEELNNIKTKLFAIVAHDLRGPLSSLQSLLYLLREHNLSEEELSEISDSLEANLHDNAAMMDNLLVWAKSQMNGINVNRREFLFENCVKSVLDQLKFQADKKSISFETEIEKGIKLNADYDMIKLVLRNLMANALKFSFANTKIKVAAKLVKDNIEFYVKDNGIGIAIENQPKIFADETFTSRGTNNEHGSGLGLTLSKEFIEGHGGNIRFESEKGKGTTFYVTLPTRIKKESLQEKTSV